MQSSEQYCNRPPSWIWETNRLRQVPPDGLVTIGCLALLNLVDGLWQFSQYYFEAIISAWLLEIIDSQAEYHIKIYQMV